MFWWIFDCSSAKPNRAVESITRQWSNWDRNYNYISTTHGDDWYHINSSRNSDEDEKFNTVTTVKGKQCQQEIATMSTVIIVRRQPSSQKDGNRATSIYDANGATRISCEFRFCSLPNRIFPDRVNWRRCVLQICCQAHHDLECHKSDVFRCLACETTIRKKNI